MKWFDRAMRIVDEARDAVVHGEDDEWQPFDTIDDLELAEADRLATELRMLKKAAELGLKAVNLHIEGLVRDQGDVTRVAGNDFMAARYGPTVYVVRPRPTDPKPGITFSAWAGDDIDRLARLSIRKTALRDVLKERGQDLETLIDSSVIQWEAPGGEERLEVLDMNAPRAPKWLGKVEDRLGEGQ